MEQITRGDAKNGRETLCSNSDGPTVEGTKDVMTPTNNLLHTNNLDTKRCLVDVQYVDRFTRLRSITHAVHNNCHRLILHIKKKRIVRLKIPS